MRNKFVSLKALALLVIFCLTGSLSRAAVNPKPFVIPELKQWTGKDGNFIPGKMPGLSVPPKIPNYCE